MRLPEPTNPLTAAALVMLLTEPVAQTEEFVARAFNPAIIGDYEDLRDEMGHEVALPVLAKAIHDHLMRGIRETGGDPAEYEGPDGPDCLNLAETVAWFSWLHAEFPKDYELCAQDVTIRSTQLVEAFNRAEKEERHAL